MLTLKLITDTSQYYRDDVELPAHQLSVIVARFSDIRAAVKAKEITDCSSIVPSLLAIEAALSEWVTTLPAGWAYTTVDTMADPDKTYGNQHHVYGDTWIASVWNSYRCVRLLCNESILGNLRRLPPSQSLSPEVDHTAQARMSRNLLNQLSSDICNSISFHLGHPKIEDGHLLFQSRAIYGFYLLWPLYIAGSVLGTPGPLRLWVVRLLDGIGYSMGIQQASALAQMLRSCTPITSKSGGQDDSEGSSHENANIADVIEDDVFIPQRRKDYEHFADRAHTQEV